MEKGQTACVGNEGFCKIFHPFGECQKKKKISNSNTFFINSNNFFLQTSILFLQIQQPFQPSNSAISDKLFFSFRGKRKLHCALPGQEYLSHTTNIITRWSKWDAMPADVPLSLLLQLSPYNLIAVYSTYYICWGAQVDICTFFHLQSVKLFLHIQHISQIQLISQIAYNNK